MPHVVSILIPTHNRAQLLEQTLLSMEHLRLPTGVEPEIIVILNGCTDDSQARIKAVVDRMPCRCRLVDEPNLGLGYARNRAIQEARGTLLCFLDDDVKVDPNWLVTLLKSTEQNGASVIGGRVELWWQEIKKPDWFDHRFEGFLSGCRLGDQTVEIKSSNGLIGANMAFRREVFEKAGNFDIDFDRVGGGLAGGGDTQMADRAIKAGFKAIHEPNAVVHHWVAKHRLEESYFCKLSMSNASSAVAMKSASLWVVTRSLLGHMVLLIQGTLIRISGRIRRREGDRRHGLIRQHVGLGGLKGWWIRLTEQDKSQPTVPREFNA